MKALEIDLISPTETIIRGPRDLKDWRDNHTLCVPGFQFTKLYKRKVWDGTWAPGKWCTPNADGTWQMRCSKGIARLLAQEFATKVHNGLESYSSKAAHRQWEQAAHNWLEENKSRLEPLRTEQRAYQFSALASALHMQWCRVALATNAGKGALIALLAEFGVAHNLPVLILCDELSVYDALEGEIAEWSNIEVGRLESGVKEPPTDAAVLAMVPTLHWRLRPPKIKGKPADPEALAAVPKWRCWVANQQMVLLDEADKANAPSWRNILLNAKGSLWRVGFSGTFPNPEVNLYEDLKLSELMGPVTSRAKNIDMIKRKVSAAPQVELHGFNITGPAGDRPREWWAVPGAGKRRHVFDNCMTNNHERHAYIRSLIQPNTPTAIIVNRVAHGERLAEAIEGAVFIDGSITPKARRQALESFQTGATKILIVTKILDRGTNRLGHTSDLLFVSGEGSTRQTLQRIGRGLRRTGGKEFLRLVDIIDSVAFGATCKDKWLKMAARYIHTAARKRIQLYRDEGFDVEIVT